MPTAEEKKVEKELIQATNLDCNGYNNLIEFTEAYNKSSQKRIPMKIKGRITG